MSWDISGDRFLVIYAVVLATAALAGLGNPGDIAALILLVVGTVFAGWALLSVSDVSRAGRWVLRRARRTNSELDPRRKPAWAGRGVDELTFAMALFGPSPLLAVDPQFAEVIGIRKDVRYPFPRQFDTGGYGGGLLTPGNDGLQ